METNESSEPPALPSSPPVGRRNIEWPIFYAAMIPLIIALIAFLSLVFLVIAPILLDRPLYMGIPTGPLSSLSYFSSYIPHIVLGIVTIVSCFLAYRLIIASGAKSKVIIPDQDYPLLAPLVSAGNADAIEQYVRLSSLGGFTGTFTKIGLTGLPFATIALTLLFSVLGVFRPDVFLDLAKLTLGAFIGSFVQGQQQDRQAPSKSRKKV